MTQIDAGALDRMLCQRFACSAPIEEALLQIGMGKRDLPTREECREWGIKLGVPDDVRAVLPPPAGDVGLREAIDDCDEARKQRDIRDRFLVERGLWGEFVKWLPDELPPVSAEARLAECERETARIEELQRDAACELEQFSNEIAAHRTRAERLEAVLRNAREAWIRYEKVLELIETASSIERAYNDVCAALKKGRGK